MSLRVRVMLLMALGILLTLGLYSALGWRSVRTLLHADLDRDMLQFTGYATQAIAESGDLTGLRLTFAGYEVVSRAVTPQGRVYAFSPVPDVFNTWSFDRTIHEHDGWRTLETPVTWHGQPLKLQAALRSPELQAGIRAHRNRMTLSALALMLLGGLSAYLLSVQVLRPLERLKRASRQVALSGDLSPLVEVPRHAGSELVTLADSFNLMLARLREFRAREATFNRQASHELRTPLAAMRLTLDAARHGYADSGETLDALDQELRRAQEITSSLLILSREGRLAQTEEVDVAALARDSARHFGADYVGLPTALIRGDRVLLGRALENLLENADRYAPGAPVQVSVLLEGPPERGRGGVVLAVQDWGPGLPEAELPHLTDEFYRVHREVSGTGLGLSVVRHVVGAHGGRLDIEPVLPHGLRVALHLPVTHGASDPMRENTPHAYPAGRG